MSYRLWNPEANWPVWQYFYPATVSTPHLRRVIRWQQEQEQTVASAAAKQSTPELKIEVDFYARDAPAAGWQVS
eukprot:SAG31_NODE_9347_length_1291_cov_1.834732_1_plen_74_part_00